MRGSQSHVLQRHRELLHEYEKEFRKIKANIKEQVSELIWERAEGGTLRIGVS